MYGSIKKSRHLAFLLEIYFTSVKRDETMLLKLQPTHTKCPLCNDFDFLDNSKLKVHLSHFHGYKFAASTLTSSTSTKKTVSGPNATATASANRRIPLAFYSDESDNSSPLFRFSPSKTPEILSASPNPTRRILWNSALLSPRKMSLKKHDISLVSRPQKSSLPVLLSSSPTRTPSTPSTPLRSNLRSASASAASTSSLQQRSKSGISKKRLYFMESSPLSGHSSPSSRRSPPLPFTSPTVSIYRKSGPYICFCYHCKAIFNIPDLISTNAWP